MQKGEFLIVIGASAGGIKAVETLLATFKPDIPAAIAVVLHVPLQGQNEWVIPRLQDKTSLPCQLAEDGMPIEKGRVYVAPANYHLIIKADQFLLGRGPMEGRWRPSIDVSFRTAAVDWNSHCIGIILSGLLDDGATGMSAIKKCGGFCVVQDPAEAEYPDMPLAVLRTIEPDHSAAVAQMAKVLEERMAAGAFIAPADVPATIRQEALLSEQVSSSIDNLQQLGEHTVYICPDCGGGLWEIRNGDLSHYRCYIGHTYTEQELMRGQAKSIENTLWVALRMMEERRDLLTRLAQQEKGRSGNSAFNYAGRAEEMRQHIELLKGLLFDQQRLNTG